MNMKYNPLIYTIVNRHISKREREREREERRERERERENAALSILGCVKLYIMYRLSSYMMKIRNASRL